MHDPVHAVPPQQRPLSPSQALDVVRAAIYTVAAGRPLSQSGKLKALDALDVLAGEVR